MGFLSGLGEFAGGVSEGISKEAQDRERRERAAAARQEREDKEAQRERDEKQRTEVAAAYGVEYSPKKVEKPTLKGDISKAAGVLASLFTKKGVERTAIAADLRDPPPVVAGLPEEPAKRGIDIPAAAPMPARAADQTNLQLPRRMPTTEQVPDVGITNLKAPDYSEATRAPPLAAASERAPEPTAIPNTKPPEGFVMPEAVPVFGTNGEEMRKPNAIDRQLRIAEAQFKSGNFKEGMAAHDTYLNMVSDRYVRNVPHMTMSELNRSLKEVNPDRDLQASKNADGLYTLTDVTDPKKPEVVMKDVTVGHVQDIFQGELQADPAKRALLANASDETYQKMTESRQRVQTLASQKVLADAQAKDLGVKTEGAEYALDETKDFDKRLTKMTEPWAAVKYGPEFIQFAQEGGIKYKKDFIDKIRATDPETAAILEQPENTLMSARDAQTQAFYAIPGARAGLIRPVADKNGDVKFAVTGPDGHIAGWKDDPYEANRALTAAIQAGEYGKGVKDAHAAGLVVRAAQAGPKPTAATAPKGGPKAAPAAAAPAAKDPKGPGLPEKVLTPKERAAATIAKVRADQAAAKAAEAAAAKADAQATKDEDAEIAGLRTEVFELEKAASKAKGDAKFDYLRQKDPLNKRIRELERAQRARRAKGRPVQAAALGVS